MKLIAKKILIKTKKLIFDSIAGNNLSKFKGEGYDFLELREYEDGEDVKNIDWIISAKMQKPYVKVFLAQKQLNITIVPILNGSVFFGTKRLKQELITEISSILSFISLKQGDIFESFIANSELIVNTKKSKKIFSSYKMVENLINYNPIGKDIDYQNIINKLFFKLKKKSIIFLIGDFFDIDLLDLKLLSKKHEIFIIITRDRFEENPVDIGNINLIDPQTSQSFEGNINSNTIKNYKKMVGDNDNRLYVHLQKSNIRFTKIYTDEEPIVKIMKLLR